MPDSVVSLLTFTCAEHSDFMPFASPYSPTLKINHIDENEQWQTEAREVLGDQTEFVKSVFPSYCLTIVKTQCMNASIMGLSLCIIYTVQVAKYVP